MNAQETQLYWEMVRTIRLLGGESDILKVLEIVNSPMPQGESIEETFRLVKCWNDNVENQIDEISENHIYEKVKEPLCK